MSQYGTLKYYCPICGKSLEVRVYRVGSKPDDSDVEIVCLECLRKKKEL